MSSKHVLITGVAGFIGFHLAEALRKQNATVIGIDNFNDYYEVQLKKDRAQNLEKLGVTIIKADICDPGLFLDLLQKEPITHIVHLAAQAGVRYSLINPQAYIHSNIQGFLNLLEGCRHYPHIPLIYASSSSVYGNNCDIPFSVDDRTDNQASLYGVTKKTNELMACTYHHLYDIPVTGLRFFTVYGPWGRPDMAYYSFTKSIDAGIPIDVYAFDKMYRDFTYIDDIISGVIAAMDLQSPLEIFNLGNHRSESLKTLVESIEDCLGKKAILRHLPIQPGDIEVTYADIAHSQKMLHFQPATDLQTGISKFVEWYKKGGHSCH